jgi:two-component system CheB/CheR fusion protein
MIMPDLSQWKVLLIDDEPDSLNLMHDMLQMNGAQVYRAAGGTEALNLLQTLIPTLIVLDLAMPKPDGWDSIAMIKSRPDLAHIPVVAVTAYGSEMVIEQAHRSGFRAVIDKPIKVNSLISQLQRVVENA